MSDEETVRRPRRGKRPAAHIEESSSDSESDCCIEITNKRKKTHVIESESSSDDSSGSSLFRGSSRIRRVGQMTRVLLSDESSSEESSSEESSSEEDVGPRPARGRVPRVESDESSDSSSESEDESSESGRDSGDSYETCENTDEEAMLQAAIQESVASAGQSEPKKEKESSSKSKAPAVPDIGGFASDSSDGQSEKCPICLISFTNQEIGSPETCDHTFCAVCIQEWAKNVNTCPVDRQVFSLILVRKQLNGKVIKKIPIENREAREPQESDTDPTFCEVCGRSDREDRLLLCDGCDLGYHLECLNPPMEMVPIEEWFCPDCAFDQSLRLAEEVEMQEGELFDLLDDMVQIRPRTSRLLPRTRQSERVRATIRSLHHMEHRTHEPAMQQPSTSGIESVGADSSSVTSGRRTTTTASAATVRRRKVVRRKTVKKRRKRRTTKARKKPVRRKTKVTKKTAPKGSGEEEDNESEDNEDYVPKKKRRKRRKRKMGRRKKKISRRRTARTAVPRSVKGRLAEQLGMRAPTRPGMSLPVVRSRVTLPDIDLQRSRAGIPTLHIFGQQNELDYFSSDNEEINEGGSVAVAARPRIVNAGTSRLLARKKILSAAALQSHAAVASPRPARSLVQQEPNTAASAPVDLIGSILDSQKIWHSKTSSVTIKPDGSLEVNKDRGGTSVTNAQGTVVCDSVSDKNKTDGSLIRSDERFSEVNGSNSSPIDLGSASARTTQTPMYPGRGDNSNRPPPSSGFHQFGGNRYSAPSYSNYQGGRDFSNFSSSASNFDANSSRAGYTNYLNSGLPPPPLRNTPVRFRVTPRYPIRRPPGPPRQDPSKPDDKKSEDGGEGSQKPPEEEEDDEIDIYSDIEAGGGGSGGPSAGGSEQDETERNMEASYEALPPPPEPSALLMGFGEQALSEEEPTSDSELVIDDNVVPSSPHDQNESGPQIPESEKYDPAEPLADSDDDDGDDEEEEAEEEEEEEGKPPLPLGSKIPDEDIPLPPGPPSLPFSSNTNISHHIINSSSNSNNSYLHSPTYGEASFETDKLSSVADDGVVSKVVKEVIKKRLQNSSGIISVGVVSGSSSRRSSRDEEEDECPNFSIYSATSMDIARRTGQEEMDTDTKEEDNRVGEESESEMKQELESKRSDTDMLGSENSEMDDKSQSAIQDRSPSPDIEEMNEIPESNGEKGDKKEDDKDDEDKNKDDDTDRDEKEGKEDKGDKEDKDGPDATDNKEERIGEIDKEEIADKDINVDSQPEEKEEIEADSDSSSSIDDASCEKSISDITDGLEQKPQDADVTDGATKVLSEETKLDDSVEVVDKTSDTNKEEEGQAEKQITGTLMTEDAFDSDNDSLIGGATSAISAVALDNNPPVSCAPSGLEGLDTETISETEEAINFDDISQDGNDIVSAEEDGEISSEKKKKKKKSRRNLDADGKMLSDLSGEIIPDRELTPPEEGEIIDDRPKLLDIGKRDKKSVEKKDSTRHEVEASKVSDENFDISKSKEDDKKKKKKEKKSTEKDRPILESSENRRKSKEKNRRSEEPNISWKKPSKSTKERNYRDTKTTKPDDAPKDKDKEDDGKDTAGKKKKKEKRKDMERYDVRKVVSDKRRRRKDEFGRDLSRDRTCSRSRSRSHRRSRDRSRSLSKSRRHRSPVRSRRSRSRSRYRTRSRSYRRSRSKSKNRSRRKSKEKSRRSRSKERSRARVSRSRSRGRRSRTRSRSHSRPKNKSRMRSRSRSPLKQRERKDRADRSHVLREIQRFHARRSWSRTWTPSWSRSRSRSLSCSSFTHSRSPSVRHFNRSYSRSFSRSWSRERYERIPLEKTGTMSSKAPKKLTIIVSNTKDGSDRQKKEKKKKKDKKIKEVLGSVEKRKKRKEKSPAPSKEVFTSGDNILVSVNFNKSSKAATNKDISSAALPALSKDAIKRKRDEAFEAERDVGKKMRKDKAKDKNKGSVLEKAVAVPQAEKKGKKQVTRGNKSARMAALLKQKPVAIIDLDQSPFREQTPSPRDLIVLSDSDDDARNKGGEHEEIAETLSVCRGMRPDSTSPQSPAKGVHNVPTSISVSRSPETEQLKLMSAVSNYLSSSTGPKTPPEPQIKFSIASKQPQLRSINNPLQEEDDILPEDTALDDSDQRIEEELDRSLGEIVHKGPNTPPEPRGPTTPCSPPTSPDAYDPFDPTKSGTPSPAGPEASMDGPPSPPHTPADEMQLGNAGGSAGRDSPLPSDLEDMVGKTVEARAKSPALQPAEEASEEPGASPDRTKAVAREAKSPVGMTESITLTPQLQNEELPPVAEISEVSKVSHGLPSNIATVSEGSTKSPERKIGVVITTPQSKLQSTPIKPPVFPVPTLKQVAPSQQAMTSTPSHAAPPPLFPALTPVNIANMLCTPPANLGLGRTNIFNPPTPLSVPALLQHVSNATTPVQARLPTDKPPVPAVPIRPLVQNGEQPKPQDTTTEVVDMDLDSPYSPGSSEGDDLFDPPADTPTRSSQPAHPADRPKAGQPAAKGANKLAVPASNLPSHKSPNKVQDKFDTLFGVASAAAKAPGTAAPAKAARKGHKGAKGKAKHVKGGKKEIAIKMDEDQLQILDELPSSAVELQVKDKFLKKLNRQERVVEEVKLSLKPHYNRKHITKEEYKDILRKSVPKICHNKSGEINPVKIATLVEAYVKKVRYEKKKNASSSSGTNSTPAKAKVAKNTAWS